MQELGILLHISSLPGKYGIGDFGPEAHDLIDKLAAGGFNSWQLLPLNHPGYGNSPYNPVSAFALNPYLISPELLLRDGLLTVEELTSAELPNDGLVDFEVVISRKNTLLQLASARLVQSLGMKEVVASIPDILKPYLAYICLSEQQGSSAWYEWPEIYKRYSEELFWQLLEQFTDYMLQQAVIQRLAHEQLKELKSHAASQNIRLVGDIPLYLSYDSAEVWANQELFKLDSSGAKLKVAGVPPDAFSDEGQLWGNPVYDWAKMQETGFDFFIRRISEALDTFDILRLDHFIGYVNYWEIEGDAASAQEGKWVKALPEEFFGALLAKYPVERFIAEDLGVLNDEVCHIRDSHAFPGMIVLQFCFEDSIPEVEKYPSTRVIYTGTHDNKTTRQWFEELDQTSSSALNFRLFCLQNGFISEEAELKPSLAAELMIRTGRKAPCGQLVIPMQDILSLGAEARMNVPGTALGNWQWRMRESIQLHN